MKFLIALSILICACPGTDQSSPFAQGNKTNTGKKYTQFHPGEIWKDNKGVAINAHGGGMLYDDETYYWFGEHKVAGGKGNRAQVGVHVYSSTDLYNWKDEGIALADSMMGRWKMMGNPAKGDRSEITFDSQSTYVINVQGMDDAYIFMGDRWEPQNPIDGPYVWLPIQWENGQTVIRWTESWDLGVFEK